MIVIKAGPSFPNAPDLTTQLERSVAAHRCQAMVEHPGTCWNGSGRRVLKTDPRCESLYTKEHNGRRLCWVHRAASDNLKRSRPLEYVGNSG